ncbi:hypothetical protein L0337_29735 [candidate division KSB1 bacterium]|nr:hypothetical protein [candidate division KSB1 bacterium]
MMRVFRYCMLAATLAGCSLFESEEARVSFTFINYAQIKREMIRLTFTDGRRIWNLDGTDFKSEYDGPHSSGRTRTFETARSGELKVTFKLIDQGEVISSGQFELPLRSDWGWGIDFLPGPARENPIEGCFGCFGAKVFALDSSYAESLTDSLYAISQFDRRLFA